MSMYIVEKAMPYLLQGFGSTVFIAAASLVIAFVLSVFLTLLYISENRALRMIARVYIKIFRNTPFMIQVYLVYYALPALGVRFPALQMGIAALAMYSAAYLTVILKMGIDSVHKGQKESAEALGMPYLLTMRRIILPQIGGVVIPPITNQIVTSIKESSVLSVITVAELTLKCNEVIALTYRPFEVYLLAAMLYWAVNLVFETASKVFERKYARQATRLKI